jgi:hypothetical protein
MESYEKLETAHSHPDPIDEKPSDPIDEKPSSRQSWGSLPIQVCSRLLPFPPSNHKNRQVTMKTAFRSRSCPIPCQWRKYSRHLLFGQIPTTKSPRSEIPLPGDSPLCSRTRPKPTTCPSVDRKAQAPSGLRNASRPKPCAACAVTSSGSRNPNTNLS